MLFKNTIICWDGIHLKGLGSFSLEIGLVLKSSCCHIKLSSLVKHCNPLEMQTLKSSCLSSSEEQLVKFHIDEYSKPLKHSELIDEYSMVRSHVLGSS